mmetsp:Transcript_842/g.2144  ORF Transcript_842/g.2144 Transcript_842/m.2144 type:complete len:415 (-) Transcript_842:394-1638(-)
MPRLPVLAFAPCGLFGLSLKLVAFTHSLGRGSIPPQQRRNSGCLDAAGCLDIQDDARRVFDNLLDSLQECDGLSSVDEPVVVGEGHVHHGPGDDLSVDDHGPLVGGVHTEDGRLRWVDDGGGEEGAKDAAVGDGEGAAGHVVDGHGAVARLLAQHRDRLLDVGKGHPVGVPQHRDHEAFRGGHRDGNVAIVLINNVVPVDDGVDRGHLLQRVGRRLDKGAHEPELHAVLLHELVLVLLPEGHEVGHVDLVKGGEHGVGVLGPLEPLGDALPHAGHGHAPLPGAPRGRRDGRGRLWSRSRRLLRSGRGGSLLWRGRRWRRGGWGGLLLLGGGGGGLRGGGGGLRGGLGPGRSKVDLGHRLANHDCVVLRNQNLLHHAGAGGPDVDRHLVRLHLNDHLVLSHGVAWRLVYRGDGSL